MRWHLIRRFRNWLHLRREGFDRWINEPYDRVHGRW